MKGLFVTGTDTGVGKSLVCLALCLKFCADYWKPVQTGEDKDSDFIKKFIPASRIHPSSYEMKLPLSPNQAAQKEQKRISLDKIQAPRPFRDEAMLDSRFRGNDESGKNEKIGRDEGLGAQDSAPLIVEGIGGVYVPFNDKQNVMDLILKLKFPVLVVARSGLGTLNHSLLTLSALRQRGIEPLGFILSGPPHKDNKRDLEKLGKVPVLLELPIIDNIRTKNLLQAFRFFRVKNRFQSL